MKPSRQDIYNAMINRMVRESLEAKNNAFALEHAQDTDQELIAYIRSCARQLGHVPHPKEVVGWPMIIERFGSWGDALSAAALPFPRTPNTPAQFMLVIDEIEEQKRIYRKRKSQKKLLTRQRQVECERKKKETAATQKKKHNRIPVGEE